MPLLINGGAGYTGSHVTCLPADVITLDNLSLGHRVALVNPGVELAEADISDAVTTAQTFQENHVESVHHYAACSLHADPSLAARVLDWKAARSDPRDIIASAWRWISGPRGARFPR